jgi:hypothetical protein
MRPETKLEAVMKQTAFLGGTTQDGGTHWIEGKLTAKRMRLFSQLAHDWEYEGEDVHLGSEAITVYAV